MNVKQYLEKTGVKKKYLADKAEMCPATITHILDGKDIHLSIAGRLVKATKGQITYDGLMRAIAKPTRRGQNKSEHKNVSDQCDQHKESPQ